MKLEKVKVGDILICSKDGKIKLKIPMKYHGIKKGDIFDAEIQSDAAFFKSTYKDKECFVDVSPEHFEVVQLYKEYN